MDNQERSRKRSQLGFSRELQVERDHHAADPSRGGSAGYPLWYRIRVLNTVALHGIERAVQVHQPCRETIYNWLERIVPYEQTGNKEREAIVGTDLLLLTAFLYVYSDAELDEVAAFIYNKGGELYSRQMISSRKQDLDYSKKRASTEAYQAFLPRNVQREKDFFEQGPPLGIRTIRRRHLLDFDETGIALQQCTTERPHPRTPPSVAGSPVTTSRA